MTHEKATQAQCLLSKIERLTDILDRLCDERAAKLTGLDPKAPGPKRHIIESLDCEWSLVGKMVVDFFIEAWDATIRSVKEELRCFVLTLYVPK